MYVFDASLEGDDAVDRVRTFVLDGYESMVRNDGTPSCMAACIIAYIDAYACTTR